MITLLMKYGGNINQTTSANKTALYACVESCFPRKCATVLKTLLLCGSDVRIKYNRRKSALDKALDRGQRPMDVDWLFILWKNVCHLLHAAGATVSKHSQDRAWTVDEEGKITKPCELDKEACKPVLTLTSLCRRVIRTHLLSPDGGDHNNLLLAIPQLPLPARLKHFLLFYIDDVDLSSNCVL